MAGLIVYLERVAPRPEVVVRARFFPEPPELSLHLVGGLPGADDHFPDAAHRLAVGRHDRQRAQVLQDVFRRDRLLADPAFGEGHVLGNPSVEVMGHHHHVERLFQRIHRVGPRRRRRRGDDVRLPADLDDVRSVAATCPFGVEGVDGPALEGCDGRLDETRSR